jgi:hypothetical protein
MRFGRLIGSRYSPQGDVDAIPAVNHCDGQCQVRQFSLCKRAPNPFIDFIGYVTVADIRHRFCPGQRSWPVRLRSPEALRVHSSEGGLAGQASPGSLPG